MDDKGFITPMLAIGIMMTSLFMMAYAYTNVTRINVHLQTTKEPLVELIDSQNNKINQEVD